MLFRSERSRAGLIERVRTVKFAASDIEAARAALSRLVEGGNAWAAVDLGSTYDPIILDALGVRNFPADVAKARVWYQRAQQMGRPKRSDCSRVWTAANDDPDKEAALATTRRLGGRVFLIFLFSVIDVHLIRER